MEKITLLMLGDIIGRTGRMILNENLDVLRAKHKVDLVIANGENSAGGLGITVKTYRELKRSGVDVVTLGNHLWDKKDIFEIIEFPDVVRPLNYPAGTPGAGYRKFDAGGMEINIISLLGRVFMPRVECPFRAMDALLENIRKDSGSGITIVDFHAEATSEKVAMGYFLDGRVSLVAGTHTHVQTNDELILPGGTGYITDLGLTGGSDGVIGTRRDIILGQFKDQMPRRFEISEGKPTVNGIVADISTSSGKCTRIEKINLKFD